LGKIGHWGVSEWTPEQMRDAVTLCEREGLAVPETDQPRYSMLQREAEAEVFPACAELGFGVLVFSPLAQGVLTGKYRGADDVPEGSRAATQAGKGFIARFLNEPTLARVERVRSIAQDLGVPLGRLAIAWTLRRPEVTTAIVGATRLEQIEENVAAAELELDEGTLARIDEALA
jgi:aryl-alcohol dehydrogenase-like predicted oxidoreductase